MKGKYSIKIVFYTLTKLKSCFFYFTATNTKLPLLPGVEIFSSHIAGSHCQLYAADQCFYKAFIYYMSVPYICVVFL